jgi:NDP-sugar pyrophosphorylase family protein
MNVVVPMAGRGSRFADRGVRTPKPLIPVAGRPMIAWALESLVDVVCSRIVFVVLERHEQDHGVTALLRRLAAPRSVQVVRIPEVTEGQLCTVLAARDIIDSDEDVLVASSDTYVTSRLGEAISGRRDDCRGIISVAAVPGDRWSFARVGPDGGVVEVTEKVRISNHASTGLYYFASGREFVGTADGLIRAQRKTRGEYYVIPVYQEYIARGWRVEIAEASQMWDLGTPEAKAEFEAAVDARSGEDPQHGVGARAGRRPAARDEARP